MSPNISRMVNEHFPKRQENCHSGRVDHLIVCGQRKTKGLIRGIRTGIMSTIGPPALKGRTASSVIAPAPKAGPRLCPSRLEGGVDQLRSRPSGGNYQDVTAEEQSFRKDHRLHIHRLLQAKGCLEAHGRPTANKKDTVKHCLGDHAAG